MTLVIDTESEPGTWIRAIGRGCLAEAMPICRACGRPQCDHPDPVFCGVIPDQSTRDRQPGGLGGEAERVPVHIHSDSETEARHHAR